MVVLLSMSTFELAMLDLDISVWRGSIVNHPWGVPITNSVIEHRDLRPEETARIQALSRMVEDACSAVPTEQVSSNSSSGRCG